MMYLTTMFVVTIAAYAALFIWDIHALWGTKEVLWPICGGAAILVISAWIVMDVISISSKPTSLPEENSC